ncbi:MAG: TonB-dependent receptor [Gemmatimonadaceae bacterium]|nr:TonB-dependent receptor [Gemmatimonadaceae bacterium]
MTSFDLRLVIRVLAAISILASATALRAQTITGSVTSPSGTVAGATVRLLELERVVRTGAGGRFTFGDVPKGTYRIFVAAQGFASATDTVRLTSDTTTVAVMLRESATRFDEIVVSASPGGGLTSEQYQSTASKSRSDLLGSPGTTFAEKISDLPGVAMRGLGSAPNRPILRGLGDNEVLVLEDGLRMGDIATYDPAHATPVHAMEISQIDVVRGPATILYGPSTIGGIVNVITDIVPDVADRRVSGTLSAEGSTGANQVAGYFDNVFSDGHQAFKVSAGGVHGEDVRIPGRGYTDPGSGKEYQLDRMPQSFDRNWGAGAGYTYQAPFGTIGIGGKHFETNYGITGAPPDQDFENFPPSTSRITQGRTTLELRSLFNASSKALDQLRITAAYNDYNQSEFPTAQDSSGVSDPRANHFHKQSVNAIVQFQQQPWGRLHGTLGLWSNFEKLKISGDQPLGPNSLTTGLAGYAYEEFMATERTRIQGGLRYDYNRIQTHPFAGSTDSVFQTLDESRNSNAVTASLGAVHQLDSHLSATFSAARSFRAPTVQELFANGLDAASGTYSLGDASLKPETGYGIDASLRGAYGKVSFDVSPYLNYIHNYIFGFLRGDTIQEFPVRQFAPTNARLFGFEASVTLVPVQSLALRLSTDYVNAQDTRLDQPLPFTPPLRGLFRATYQKQRLTGMFEERVAARQSRLGDGDTPTAGYAISNVGVGVRIANGAFVHDVRLYVDNVFNQVYRDNLSVVKDFIPQPGRAVRLGYEMFY